MGFFYIWGVPVPLFLRYENLNRNSYTPFIWGSRTPMVLFTHIIVNVPWRFTVPCKFGVSLTHRGVSLPDKSESVVIELPCQHVFLLVVIEKEVLVTWNISYCSSSSFLCFSDSLFWGRGRRGNTDPLNLLGSSHVIFGQMINLSVLLDCGINFTYISTNCFLVVSFIIALFHI